MNNTKMIRILRLGICILLLSSLFLGFNKVSAGICEWSPEAIPTRLNNLLGPVGVDIRDLVFTNSNSLIYAAPGDSIADKVIFQSTDGGSTWIPITVPITTDLIAIMPEDNDVMAIANKSIPAVYLSVDGGLHWKNLDQIRQSPAGAPATAIYDIAISPQRNDINYLVVVGKEAGDVANLWYQKLGIILTTDWLETNTLIGFDAASEATTFAFSPSFIVDPTVTVITDKVGTNAELQILNIVHEMWNTPAGYDGFPCTIVSSTGLNRLDSASLSLIPGYMGTLPETRTVFIGLTVNGDATAVTKSGIYRFEDTVLTTLCDNTTIHSVAVNDLYLVAGSYDTNTVYVSTNPYEPVPTIQESDIIKSPGGENKVVAAWMGYIAVAGTSGNESAFAKSEDNGFVFNDISLIDTVINNAEDTAIVEDGHKIYLVTDDGTDLSVWIFETYWQRVFSKKDELNYIVRIASESEYIYLAKRSATDIYYNDSSGTTRWLSTVCSIDVQDLAVASPHTILVIDLAGMIARSINGGATWYNTSSTLNSGATIVSASANLTLAGSQNGFVAYTLNNGFSWSIIPQIIEPGAGRVQLVADEDFGHNKFIYAASDKINGNIMRWAIGYSTAWTDIFDGNISGGIYGLAITNDIIYALEYDIFASESTLWRHLSPKTIPEESPEWSASTTIDDPDDGQPVVLNATPQALKSSLSKLWAVRTNGTINKLYSYTDIIDLGITLLNPIDGYISFVNSLNGIAYDLSFGWEGPAIATEYEFLMAQDEVFYNKTTTIYVTPIREITYITVGPNQSGPNWVFYAPGLTYYWKVRIIAPIFSVYSETRHFTIFPLVPPAYDPVTLLPAKITSLHNPSFSWYPMAGVTEYEFELSDNPEMIDPLVDVYTETTSVEPYITLEYDKNYFWRVRTTKPMVSPWSSLGTFIIIGPVTNETVTATPQATTTVYVPYFITFMTTPGYVIGAITTMVILIGIISVLLFSRRSVKISGGESMKPQPKLDRYTEYPVKPITPETLRKEPTVSERDKEGPDLILGAKNFTWMATPTEEIEEEKPKLSEKERHSLGKKLADRIRELSKKGELYLAYPEDTPMLLVVWAEYRSLKETSNYLIKSFESNPYKAIKFLKCYLPRVKFGEEAPPTRNLTIKEYTNMAKVIDTNKLYETLAKLFKFKAEKIEDIVPVMPEDRDLANQFMHLHIRAKGSNFTQ
jgi:photosystem II stability/assembly factor-like uncharacterized protein